VFAREMQTDSYLESIGIESYIHDDVALALDINDPGLCFPAAISRISNAGKLFNSNIPTFSLDTMVKRVVRDI
jgi:hypothetical protein